MWILINARDIFCNFTKNKIVIGIIMYCRNREGLDWLGHIRFQLVCPLNLHSLCLSLSLSLSLCMCARTWICVGQLAKGCLNHFLCTRQAKGALFEDDGDGYEFIEGQYLLTHYVAKHRYSVVIVRVSEIEGSWKRPQRLL